MKDLSKLTDQQRNIWIVIIILLTIFCIGLSVYEGVNSKTYYSIPGTVIEIISVVVLPLIKKQYHRGDQIIKIFENCSENEKKEIYQYIKKYDKQTH